MPGQVVELAEGLPCTSCTRRAVGCRGRASCAFRGTARSRSSCRTGTHVFVFSSGPVPLASSRGRLSCMGVCSATVASSVPGSSREATASSQLLVSGSAGVCSEPPISISVSVPCRQLWFWSDGASLKACFLCTIWCLSKPDAWLKLRLHRGQQ